MPEATICQKNNSVAQDDGSGAAPRGDAIGQHAPIARALYAERRRRDAFLPQLSFEEPIWDFLLDLYIAYCEKRDTSVGSACIAAQVPASTALRHLVTLQQEGAITRSRSRQDGRIQIVSLTEDYVRRLDLLLPRIRTC